MAFRQTGTRRTHIVSTGLRLVLVSSCAHSSGPANPYRATRATPLRLVLSARHPSSCRTLRSDPHTHASERPSATMEVSAPTAASRCGWRKFTPQALSGWKGSVQFAVSEKSTGRPGRPGSPLPDWILKYATLNVVCARARGTVPRHTPIQHAQRTATRTAMADLFHVSS